MKQKILTFLMTISLVLTPGLALQPVLVRAQTSSADAICEGADDGSEGASCDGTASGETLNKVLRAAIRIFQGIIGIISIFVMLLAGLNYITSGGDSAKTKSARERIIYAAIGLAVVAFGEILVQFALNRV